MLMDSETSTLLPSPLLETSGGADPSLHGFLVVVLPEDGAAIPSLSKLKKAIKDLLSVTDSLILKLQRTLSTLRACRKPFPLTTT